MTTLTLADIQAVVDATLEGDATTVVHGIAPLDDAGPGQLSFLSDPKYRHHLAQSKAAAVLVKAEFAADVSNTVALIVDNPYLAYAKASALFDQSPKAIAGVHPSAIVGDNVVLGEGVSIGPLCVIGDNVHIGDNTFVGASCTIADGVSIGRSCTLAAQVVVYHSVQIADRVELHSHCVIGADGFGFAPGQQGWQKIVQLGSVQIGNDVSVGASTTIDRGAISDTIISDGVIIDNQVQIAHNVVIGKNTALAGCVGIAGSAKIGANCTIGGGVGVAGHLTLCDGVHLTGMTLVSKSISEPGAYSSGTALSRSDQWRKNAVRFLQLDKLHKRVVALEKNAKQ